METRRRFVMLRLGNEERKTLQRAALISRQPLSTYVRELALDLSRALLESRTSDRIQAGKP